VTADWIWIDAEVARAIHEEQIAEHGGPSGVRDTAGLEGAMARARNLAAASPTQPTSQPLMLMRLPGIIRSWTATSAQRQLYPKRS
jgi:hypothetical protein